MPGSYAITSEVLKASLNRKSKQITDLYLNTNINENKIPSGWNDIYIIRLFKKKGSANMLKLTEHVLEMIERAIEKYIRGLIKID